MDENLVLGLYVVLVLVSGGLVALFARRLRARGGAPSWPRLLLGNLLVLFVLLAAGLLAGEIYYRFVYDATDALEYNKVSVRWFERYYHQNSWGCRDNVEYANAIQPGKRRITFLGDSFTAGHGVKEVEALFAFRLRQAHPDWEIHVLARPGFDTSNELQSMITFFTNHYQVDEVVLVYCLNDIGDLLPEGTAAIQRVYDEVEHSGWLRRHSYFVNTVYNRLSLSWNPDLKQYFQLILAAYRGPAWQQQQQRLKELRDLVQSHGGHLCVVTFPFFQALGPNYEYQFVHDELDQCWRELRVPHLDLLPVYKGLPPKKLMVNRFDSHPNEYAHALAAAAIDKFLQEQLAARPDRR
jgi:lysophospholipase L1-like esterase